MRLKRTDVILLKLLFLLAAGIIVFQALGRSDVTSLLFYMTFPVTVLLWLRTVRKNMTGMDLIMLVTLALAVISVLLDAGRNNVSLNFGYIRKVIIFFMTLLFLQTAYRLQIDEKMVGFINRTVDFLTIFLMVMYSLYAGQMFLLGGLTSAYLTFQIGNPNLTGIFLTCFYMLEVYRIFTPERWYWKLLHVSMAVCLVVFVNMTQSRNCLIVIVLFTLIVMWLIFRGRRNLHMGSIFAMLISAFPALFLATYISIIYTPWVQRLFRFLVGEGKNLDSRIRIWMPALQNLWESPIIGSYYAISEGTGMSQMHNSHLDIAVSYGIPVLLLVCLLLFNYLHQSGRQYADKQGFIYILGFVCVIILGIGEAALFSGGLSFYIFAGAFLLLAGRQEHTKIAG